MKIFQYILAVLGAVLVSFLFMQPAKADPNQLLFNLANPIPISGLGGQSLPTFFTNQTTVEFSGTVQATNGGNIISVQLGGENIMVGGGGPSASFQKTFIFPDPNGVKVFFLTAIELYQDGTGTQLGMASILNIPIVYDQTPPTITFNHPYDQEIFFSSSYPISVSVFLADPSVINPDTIRIFLDGQDVTSLGLVSSVGDPLPFPSGVFTSYEWTSNITEDRNLLSGSHQLRTEVADRSGNQASQMITFFLAEDMDETCDGPDDPSPLDVDTEEEQISLLWHVQDNSLTLSDVKLGIQTLTESIPESNIYASNQPLAEGTNTFQICATDAAGNKNKREVRVRHKPVLLRILDPFEDEQPKYVNGQTSHYMVKGKAASSALVQVTTQDQLDYARVHDPPGEDEAWTNVEKDLDNRYFAYPATLTESYNTLIFRGIQVNTGDERQIPVDIRIDDKPPLASWVNPAGTTYTGLDSIRFKGSETRSGLNSGINATAGEFYIDNSKTGIQGDGDDDGNFSIGPLPLPLGSYEFGVSVADNVGNKTRMSKIVQFLDVVPPHLSVVFPESESGFTTFDEIVYVEGRTDKTESIVTITNNSTQPPTFTNAELTEYTGPGPPQQHFSLFVPVPLGQNHLTIRAVDQSGNTVSINRIVTRTRPLTNLVLSPSTPLTVNVGTTVTLYVKSEDGAVVTVNGTPVTLDSAYEYSGDFLINSKTTTIIDVQAEKMGKDPITRSVSITGADLTPPLLTVSSPVEGQHTEHLSYVTVAGTTEPGASLAVNGQLTTVSPTGAFTTTAQTLIDHNNVIVILARDADHNDTIVRRTINVVDTVPPPLVVNSPHAGDIFMEGSTIILSGTTEMGAQIVINGQPHAVTTGTNFTYTLQATQGLTHLVVEAKDTRGNTAATTIPLTVNPEPELQPDPQQEPPPGSTLVLRFRNPVNQGLALKRKPSFEIGFNQTPANQQPQSAQIIIDGTLHVPLIIGSGVLTGSVDHSLAVGPHTMTVEVTDNADQMIRLNGTFTIETFLIFTRPVTGNEFNLISKGLTSGNETVLATGGFNGAAAYSAATDEVVFIRGTGNRNEIWMIQPNGENLHQVTQLNSKKLQLAMSPDAGKIFLIEIGSPAQQFKVGVRSTTNPNLWTFSPLTVDITQVLSDPVWGFTNDSVIVSVASGSTRSLAQVNTTTGTLFPISATDGGYDPFTLVDNGDSTVFFRRKAAAGAIQLAKTVLGSGQSTQLMEDARPFGWMRPGRSAQELFVHQVTDTAINVLNLNLSQQPPKTSPFLINAFYPISTVE